MKLSCPSGNFQAPKRKNAAPQKPFKARVPRFLVRRKAGLSLPAPKFYPLNPSRSTVSSVAPTASGRRPLVGAVYQVAPVTPLASKRRSEVLRPRRHQSDFASDHQRAGLRMPDGSGRPPSPGICGRRVQAPRPAPLPEASRSCPSGVPHRRISGGRRAHGCGWRRTFGLHRRRREGACRDRLSGIRQAAGPFTMSTGRNRPFGAGEPFFFFFFLFFFFFFFFFFFLDLV